MLIIVDKKITRQAKAHLEKFGEIYELETTGIVADDISGHPDIFMCKVNDDLVVSPQAPIKLQDALKKHAIRFKSGQTLINKKYPVCAAFNAVVTERYLVHLLKTTDKSIVECAEGLKTIDVKQGFTRCSLMPVGIGFITSDYGIFRKLKENGCDTLYVDPGDIMLPGQKHGFFGGCCGSTGNMVFINGSLMQFRDGDKVAEFITSKGNRFFELHQGPLIDCGSIYIL
jgi:hypothetical protein